MFDYKDLGKLLKSYQVHSQKIESRDEPFMAMVMQNGQRAAQGYFTCWCHFRKLSCAAVTEGGTLFQQHHLESVFLCRISSSTFWTLVCCGY